jgi:two-component sensor histidine kinase
MSQVDFAGYLERMILHLFSGFEGRKGRISYDLEVKNVRLDINRAIPCGLLINELVSNSLQHAFPDGREGKLLVRMKPSGQGRFSLVVGDNGIGLPDSTDPKKAESLGFQLVNDLVRQLGGTLRLDRKGGTTFYIKF